jgi:hypothetical protein
MRFGWLKPNVGKAFLEGDIASQPGDEVMARARSRLE